MVAVRSVPVTMGCVLSLWFGPSLQAQAVTPFVLFCAVTEAGQGKEHLFI